MVNQQKSTFLPRKASTSPNILDDEIARLVALVNGNFILGSFGVQRSPP